MKYVRRGDAGKKGRGEGATRRRGEKERSCFVLSPRRRVPASPRLFFPASPCLRVPASLLSLFFILLTCSASFAQAKRLVILKIDGLPNDMVDRFVHERDPQSGKSLLPWFEEVFYKHGARVSNFYVRGMSLSAPSWSMLETGQHLQVKGNVEFDRLTLHSYDYLNFTPFYLRNIVGQSIDMPGTETLDEAGVPLLIDAYAPRERFASFQLYQRGMHWRTFQSAAENRFLKSPRELLDEWTTGFEVRNHPA